MRIDELVDGLIDPNAVEDIEALAESEELKWRKPTRKRRKTTARPRRRHQSASLMQLKADALERFATIRGLYEKMQPRPPEEGLRRTRPT
jgi:RNA polymerase primary sigma factor